MLDCHIQASNLSQAAFAKAIGISPAWLSQLKSRRQAPASYLAFAESLFPIPKDFTYRPHRILTRSTPPAPSTQALASLRPGDTITWLTSPGREGKKEFYRLRRHAQRQSLPVVITFLPTDPPTIHMAYPSRLRRPRPQPEPQS